MPIRFPLLDKRLRAFLRVLGPQYAPLIVGERAVNNWHYRLAPKAGGTDVTESFRMTASPLTTLYYWVFGGYLRQRRNIRDMTRTLHSIKYVAEA